jgi:YidC/Oxa1 family membrane protein insertase
MEKRLLLAFVLSAAILLGWSVIFPPPQRPTPTQQPVTTEESVTHEATTQAAAPAPAELGDDPGTPADPEAVFEATVEEEVKLENDRISVVLTNRGAAVKSYLLADYLDDAGLPVDLVQDVPIPQRSLPLQLVTPSGPDAGLYEVERVSRGAIFRWADGRGNSVTKNIALSEDGFGLTLEIVSSGSRATDAVSIGTGMRNLGEQEQDSRLALWGEGIVLADGEVERYKRRKVKDERVLTPGAVSYAGFEDAYFLSILRPEGQVSEIRLRPHEFAEGEEKPTTVLEMMTVPSRGTLRGELLGAPKEFDLLQSMGGGVEKTLDFGIFSPISVFFLKALRWIYGHVGNYGVAIILLTLGIRILLFPLMHTSTVSMRKMAKVQPKTKEIQAKYKKKKTDPQARAKMNQEMMALYKAEGVNPMAGCLPLLVQLPLLWAL